MSGIEPFIMSALAAAGEAATAVGSTIASTASSAGAAITGSAATAGEFAAVAGGTEAALGGAASSGLTASQAITAGSTLASAAGAGASLLAKPPSISAPNMPTRDNARLEADQRSMALKRRGRAATLLTGAQGVTSAPTLGSPSLTGTM
jgi:hypothetical protein